MSREVCSIEEVTEDTTEEGAVFPDNERQSESPRAPLINNPPAKNALVLKKVYFFYIVCDNRLTNRLLRSIDSWCSVTTSQVATPA
jgi:hypothetical protein